MKEVAACIDYGTSNVRAYIIDLHRGVVICSHSEKYYTKSPAPGYLELPVNKLWENCQKCVKTIFDKLDEDKEYHVIAFSFCFFGDTLIPCDAKGNPLNDLILYLDSRGQEEVGLLNDHFTQDWLVDTLGSPYLMATVPAKLQWFRKNERDFFDSIKNIYSIQRYTMGKLGLEAVSDHSLASRFMMLDINTRSWSKEILDYLGINESMLGQVLPSATVLGEIDSFGDYKLPYKIPVVLGLHDVTAGILGTGVTSKMIKTIANVAGTIEIYGRYDFSGKIKGFRSAGCVEGMTGKGQFFPSGILIEWFMRTIHGDNTEDSYDHYWQKSRFDGSNRVKVKPLFSIGKGRFDDIGLDCSREDLFTAVIESLVFEAGILVDKINTDFGIKTDTIHIGGGSSKSDKINQHKANVMGTTAKTLKVREVSAFGTAIVIAVAIGLYSSLETAMEALVKIDKEYMPDMELHGIYRKKFEEYRQAAGDAVEGKAEAC